MAFLGFFKKRGLENMKIPKVKKDLLQAERLEGEHGRQISSYQEKIESKRLYAQSERGRISDLDRKQLAKDIAELEFDISASSQQQSKARKRKRALKGLLIVLEEREQLKQSDAWGTLAGMDPQDLEDSLARLGNMDASVSMSTDRIRHVLGAPATPNEIEESMTRREREIFDELK